MRFFERLFSRKSEREAVDPVSHRVLAASNSVKEAVSLLEQTIQETLDHNDGLRTEAIKAKARRHHVQRNDPKHDP